MSGDHLEQLEAALRGVQRVRHALGEPHPNAVLVDEPDLDETVKELKQLRAEREGWRNGASQRLRHAYRSGWEERGETIAAAVSAFAGHGMAEQRAKAYVDEWWDIAPQQPAPDGEATNRA